VLDLSLIAIGVIVRQIDRLWFSDLRSGLRFSRANRPTTVRATFDLQRRRRNNLTPVLVLTGHWLEVAGYLLFLSRTESIPWTLVVAGLVAIKCRHFQEISHFGIHSALCRSRRMGDVLIEFAAQGPLALATVDDRRESHVRRHHPNANVPGLDPNLDDLLRAGLTPGCSRRRFIGALVYPFSFSGLARTGTTVWSNLQPRAGSWWRLPLTAAFFTAVYFMSGLPGVAAITIARAVLYPQLAWMSLLAEHRWFADTPRRGRPIEVEAARCVRVLRGRPVLELIARTSWLPYGDLFHFVHSTYPTIRWNYLPTMERLIGLPQFTPANIFSGHSSLIAMLYRSACMPESQWRRLRIGSDLARGRRAVQSRPGVLLLRHLQPVATPETDT
jgi:fatty acid desaturase